MFSQSIPLKCDIRPPLSKVQAQKKAASKRSLSCWYCAIFSRFRLYGRSILPDGIAPGGETGFRTAMLVLSWSMKGPGVSQGMGLTWPWAATERTVAHGTNIPMPNSLEPTHLLLPYGAYFDVIVVTGFVRNPFEHDLSSPFGCLLFGKGPQSLAIPSPRSD